MRISNCLHESWEALKKNGKPELTKQGEPLIKCKTCPAIGILVKDKPKW